MNPRNSRLQIVRHCPQPVYPLIVLAVFWLGIWTGDSPAETSPTNSGATAPSLPTFTVESVATPANTSRLFSSAVAPNPRGGWNWIGQFENYIPTQQNRQKTVPLPTGQHYLAYVDPKARPEAEWVIADLEKGTSKVVNWPGFNAVYGGALAENGRVFFLVDYAQIYYYDPTEETVKPLGRVCDQLGAWRTWSGWACMVGPDGMIYATAQTSSGLTQLLQLNPDTLEYKTFDKLGIPGRRNGLTYGYNLVLDPPWVYVSVGQGNWEIFAVNTATGEKKCLADVTGDGCRAGVGYEIDRATKSNAACVASVINPKDHTSQRYWIINGELVPTTAGEKPPGPLLSQKKYPHFEWKNTKPLDLSKPPEIDPDRPVVVSGRTCDGEINWRPAGVTNDWRELPIAVKNCVPSSVDSLTALADGSLFGSAFQYSGFFRYYPADKKLDCFGRRGPSRPKLVTQNGKVWFCGYPNTYLSAYDPTQPWTAQGKRVTDPKANPAFAGYFGNGTTEAHYCVALAAPGNGRIYICGRRERWSTGTGLGYYDIATGKKFGLATANKDIEPLGCIALPKLQRLLVSGSAGNTPTKLLVYDLDLKEVERVALAPGLINPGVLYNTGSDTQFLGCTTNPDTKKPMLYLYDFEAKKLLKTADLPGAPGPIFRRDTDGTYWLTLATEVTTLHRLDPVTLELKPVGAIEGNKFVLPVWNGQELYGVRGGEVVHVVGAGL